MSAVIATSTRVSCDHVLESGGPCPARIFVDDTYDVAAVRRAAADRGWAADGETDLCPSHRPAR